MGREQTGSCGRQRSAVRSFRPNPSGLTPAEGSWCHHKVDLPGELRLPSLSRVMGPEAEVAVADPLG